MERLSFYIIAVSSVYIFLEVRKEDDLKNILILFDLFMRNRRDAQFQIITIMTHVLKRGLVGCAKMFKLSKYV